MRALVSADDVVAVLHAWAARAADAAQRLGADRAGARRIVADVADDLVESLHRRPVTVPDLVGSTFARVHDLTRQRIAGSPAPAGDPVTGALRHLVVVEVVDTADDTRVTRPGADARGAPGAVDVGFALLLRDAYGLGTAQAAAALGLDAPETARQVALGRVALALAIDGGDAPDLTGHDVAVGDLGALADGSAPAGGRFAALRRHVAGCGVCAGVLGLQTRARALVGGLTVTEIPAAEQVALLSHAEQRARAVLPDAETVAGEIAGIGSRRSLIRRTVVVAAVVLAVVGGVLLGAFALASRPGGAPSGAVALSGAPTRPVAVTTSGRAARQPSVPLRSPTASAAGPAVSRPAGSGLTSTPGTGRTASSPRPAGIRPTTRPTRPTRPSPSVRPRATPTPSRSTAPATPSSSPPPAPATLGLSPDSGPAGAQVAVAGTGWPADEAVSVTFDGATVAMTTVGDDGSFAASFTVPGDPGGDGVAHQVAAAAGSTQLVRTFTETS